MKQFLRYTLTLVAILIATTNAWAAETCHTVTKSTFTTDASYKSGSIIKTTYYYYSQPQQQFLQITDNGYSTLSSVKFTVTGDRNDGAQKFKILYNTGSGWQYYDNTDHSLSRGGLLQGYPAGSTTITLSDDTKIKSATAFGIEFTNYNKNGSGDNNQRTITISNVSVTFSPYFQSEANGATLEAFPPTEKGTTCSTTRSFKYKYNNTVTSVDWVSSNPMFSVSSTYTNDCSGEKDVTITFKPTEIRSEITGTITGTDNNGNKIVVYVNGSSWGKEDPTYTWNPDIWNGTSQARTIYVDETINNVLSYTSSPANCTYTIEKIEDYGINNGDAITTFANNTLVARRAGKYKLTVTQTAHSISETSGYNAGETTITLDIVKHTTFFTLPFASEYYVDDEINKSTFLNTNNPDVAIQVSDKTADNRALFTYNNGILKANGATLNANAETTTITVTQTENYKWTSYSLNKTVTVKKYDLSATLNPSSTVWNSTHSDPFSVSISPANGEAINDFSVGETSDSDIATYDASSKTIQTYYTSGTADFLITRDADRKYNALNQKLTLTVNASTESCQILEDNAERSWSTIDNSGTYTIPSGTPDSLFFQAKRTAILGVSNTSNFYAEYSTDNSSWTSAMTINLGSTGTWYDLKCDIPETARYVRFRTSTGATGNKQIRNVRVTRKEKINPSIAEGETLKLPTVAFGKPSSNTFTLDWSTCSDIKIESSNSKFTIGTTPENASKVFNMPDADGNQTFTVYCNTSEIGIYTGTITIYNQSRKVSFNVTDTVNDKWTPVMTGEESYSKKVGNTWTTNFTFKNTETATPSADKSAPFYFEIDHKSFVNTDRLTRNPNHLDEVISYNPDTYEITAHNAGTAVLTFVQQGNDSYYYSSRSCTITIDKNTPTFTWKDPVYFNQKITDYFTTDNHDTEITISQPSTDEDVAILYFDPENEEDKHTLDLTTYYKETTPLSSTQVTISQAENWYWYAYEEPRTIKPCNQNNHVTFTLTQENYILDFQVPGGFSDPWADSNGPTWTEGGIHFGNEDINIGDGGWNWDDKYIIIEFTGIPNTLKFTTNAAAGATTGTNSDLLFYVSEGKRNTNGGIEYTKTWEYTSASNDVTETLNPESRILKFCYTGNLEGWFKNITVTELNQFEFIPDALDFGEVKITDNTSKTLTTKFHYANAGHNIKVELDRSSFADEAAYELAKKYITINPAAINDIGGENIGEREIQITLHSDDKTPYIIPEDAKIKIWDEANRHDYLSISGLIEPSEQEIYWSAYFQLEEPIAIPLETGDVKNAATASSNLPITYKTDNPEVIQISDDKSYFTPIAVGDATITAIQDGNQVYDRVESSKKITVTQKMVQIISWPVDFTDLILVENPDPIPLTAATYLLDLVNNRPVFSQEQTDKIEYSVENEEVVKIVDGQLVIVGLGSTTITAAINESEDSHYESTSTTLPVIVREPALGCEDMLLLDQPNEVEIFTDGMNTNEIVKNAMAIDRTLGIPGRVEFQHKGEAWKLFGNVSFYAGAIKVQQSTDGGNTWSDVPNSSVTPTQSVYNTSVATLDRNATHIRFVRPSGGQGYHYYKDVKVYPAQYLESATTGINYENINVGGTYTKKINISYSNIKSPIYYIASSSDITVSPKTFGECGKFGTQELTITWKPSTNIGQQTVTFRDSLSEISDLTINLTANIDRRKQEILWENRPEVILSHTGIDNRPIYTIDANSKAPTTLKIEYTVVEGTENAYFSNDMFFILNEGEITIKAANDGNEEYAAIEEVYNLTLQGVPPTFIGGTDNQLWNNENNWKNKLMPSDEYSIANITAPVEINNLLVDINNVRVADNASIHITSTGGLTIGEGGIQTVTTDGSAIVIDNLHSGAGFFRISPDCEDELPRITMRYQTKSTLDSGANKDATWQYIGAPGEDASVHVDYNTWLYRLDESQADWVLMPQHNNHTLSPFQGYALTQYGQPTYEWNAQMINRNCTIPLTYHFDGRKGQNLIANSYTAPIDVTQMLSKDFQMIDGQSEYYDITQTLYLYNSGSWKDWHTHDSVGTSIWSDGNNTTPGQYYAIPVLAVAKGYIPERPTIAPMQGIYVRVRAKKTGGDTLVGNIIFDYDRIVMGEGHDMHRPMRAPKKSDITSIPSENFRRLRIVATSEHSGADRLYIIQDDINTRNYDNGYDAPNQATQGIVNIYTYESGGKMEVSCANNIDSTYIGFMAGEDRTYTLHFNAIIGETLCLQDLVSGEKIYIVEGGSYTFEAEPQSTNNKRFLLHAKKAINSDMEDVNAAHIWFSNHTLYVTNATDNSLLQLYDVSGHMIFSSIIHRTPYTVDLTHLTEGVYMARLNNQVYKFVCK